jgi:hypothetical protein
MCYLLCSLQIRLAVGETVVFVLIICRLQLAVKTEASDPQRPGQMGEGVEIYEVCYLQ